jgi:hypothetical protein
MLKFTLKINHTNSQKNKRIKCIVNLMIALFIINFNYILTKQNECGFLGDILISGKPKRFMNHAFRTKINRSALALCITLAARVSLATLPAVSAHSFCHPLSRHNEPRVCRKFYITLYMHLPRRLSHYFIWYIHLRFGRSRHWVVTAACCSRDFFSAYCKATSAASSQSLRWALACIFNCGLSAAATEKQRQRERPSHSAAKGEAPRAP